METTSMYFVMAGVALIGFTGLSATGTVDTVTLPEEMVGKPVIIHDRGLEEGAVSDMFGTSTATIDDVLNDNTIRVTISQSKTLDDNRFTVREIEGGRKVEDKVIEYDTQSH